MKTIYIVKAYSGIYEDFWERNIRGFSTQESAEAFKSELKAIPQPTPCEKYTRTYDRIFATIFARSARLGWSEEKEQDELDKLIDALRERYPDKCCIYDENDIPSYCIETLDYVD